MKWIVVAILLVSVAAAQEKQVPKVVPVPPLPPARPRVLPMSPPEPTSPSAQTVMDARTHGTFRLPAGWNLARKDGELSTFRLDARTAPRRSALSAAAGLAFNPFPQSTFSGALFYLSVVPHSSAAACAAETSMKPEKPLEPALVGDVKFSRGRDEHGRICVEARDVTYTAMRREGCVRFDLVVNTFCGGEVSGAEEITEAQLGAVFKRLEAILQTVQFGR